MLKLSVSKARSEEECYDGRDGDDSRACVCVCVYVCL